MKRILITDGVHPSMIEKFESEGFSCDYKPNIALKEVLEIIHHYEGLIINSKIIIDKHFLEVARKLEFIGRLGSGLEIIDLEYAKKAGVKVYRAPEGNRNAVAEHALGMLLTLANKLIIGDGEVRRKFWDREKNRGFEIMGKTVGIIGYGNTGKLFSTKLAALGARVLVYDKYKMGFAEDTSCILETNMETIFEEADIISFHVPLTEETYHLFDEQFISQCKNESVIINTSRGKVVDTQALVKGLESGKIAGACLDVFENEKPETFTDLENEIFQALYQFDNIVLSPHVAGWTVESKLRLTQVLLNKILNEVGSET